MKRCDGEIPYENKTRTSKVGAMSKARKAQKNFLEKNLYFLKKKIQKKSHSAEKCKRGEPHGMY